MPTHLRTAWVLLALSCLPLSACAGFLTAVGGGMTEQLRATGVPAQAEVLEIWDTGWTINDSPVIGMRVRVEPPDRPAFEARIEKTTISRLATSQFQPGSVIPVRFDPNDPSVVAVDFETPAQEVASSGNPYRDRFTRAPEPGIALLPPPAEPRLYLGTADSGADAQALYEHNFVLLGGSAVGGGADARQALEQGKEIGAAMVVVYGSFVPPPGLALDVLPYRRRPLQAEQTGAPASTWSRGLFSNLGVDERYAAFWAETPPAILGVVCRPLDSGERGRLERGVVVDAVAEGSPAAAANILAGDVIVAIEGNPVADIAAVAPLVSSVAGKSVRIDLIRGGSPLSVTAQLNPASP